MSRFVPHYYLVLTSQRPYGRRHATQPPGQPVQLWVSILIVRTGDYATAVKAVKSLVEHTAYPYRATSGLKDANESALSLVEYESVDGGKGVLALHGVLSRHLTLALARKAAHRACESFEPFLLVLDHIAEVHFSVHKDWSTEAGDKLKDGRLVGR